MALRLRFRSFYPPDTIFGKTNIMLLTAQLATYLLWLITWTVQWRNEGAKYYIVLILITFPFMFSADELHDLTLLSLRYWRTITKMLVKKKLDTDGIFCLQCYREVYWMEECTVKSWYFLSKFTVSNCNFDRDC